MSDCDVSTGVIIIHFHGPLLPYVRSTVYREPTVGYVQSGSTTPEVETFEKAIAKHHSRIEFDKQVLIANLLLPSSSILLLSHTGTNF